MPSRHASFLAECLGTMLLTATVIGSGIMATRLSPDIGIQLLANGLATAAMLVVLISIFAPISGAHFNPAVSAVMVFQDAISLNRALVFGGTQIIGAILGAMLAHAMFDLPLLVIGTQLRAGTGQWISEIVATFTLVFVILAASGRSRSEVAMLVACTILAGYWFTASTSFANPAVTIGRMFTTSFAGLSPASAVSFILCQGIGAALATACHRLLIR